MSTFHVLLVWALVQAIPFLAVSILLSDCAYPSGYGDGSGNCVGVADVSLKPQRREADENENIFDITHKFTPHTPVGDSTEGIGQFLTLLTSMKNGSDYNFSEMKLPVHSGTHVDAPGHMYDNYFDEGYDVDTLDLRVLNGPALLVDVPRDKNITAEVMKSLNIPKGVRRVLFRTLNTDRRLMYKKEFDTSYVGFMKDGAQWLVDNTDIKLVGIDYLSVAAFADLIPSHLVLLRGRSDIKKLPLLVVVVQVALKSPKVRAMSHCNIIDSDGMFQDIILVEGLKLDDVQPGIYSVHCLPLRLVGAEGSPIRCILIK
ncbi:UNVERIFIED_CONTAM: Cyclase-like protein 2 [Sesamum calycinum]|uniref:Cyclase-like protein 2 n=1 Tax=Sesamum calycinum TaxID=2727403 RepID=A0AAW2PLW5_9LAMI